jgi:hypothetical protein
MDLDESGTDRGDVRQRDMTSHRNHGQMDQRRTARKRIFYVSAIAQNADTIGAESKQSKPPDSRKLA